MSAHRGCRAVPSLDIAPRRLFYLRPQTILDLVHQTIGKALHQVGIEHNLFERWNGHREEARPAPAVEMLKRNLRALG